MPRLRDEAICVRHMDWSETSQVVVLVTGEHGKVRGLAKGSKRMSPSSIARYSGGIELLTRGEIVGITRASSDLATLTEWDLHDDYPRLRRDLRAQRLAMFAADVAHAVLIDEDPHPGAFVALRRVLESLSDGEEGGAAVLRYQWAMLVDAGYRPELWRDVRSDDPLAEATTYAFDPRAGGFTTGGGPGDWRVRATTLAALRGLAAEQGGDAERDTVERANRLLCSYLRTILDRELPTMRYVLGGH